MKYTVKNVCSDNFVDTIRLISGANDFAHANKKNTSPEYNHQKVIEFLNSDSEECDSIIENIMRDGMLS